MKNSDKYCRSQKPFVPRQTSNCSDKTSKTLKIILSYSNEYAQFFRKHVLRVLLLFMSRYMNNLHIFLLLSDVPIMFFLVVYQNPFEYLGKLPDQMT